MAPPASDDPRLVGHHDYSPTVNITIDPHPDESLAPAPAVSFSELLAKPSPPPPPTPVPAAECCTQTEYDPARILEVVGISFGVGVLVGGMLVFAFSRPAVSDA